MNESKPAAILPQELQIDQGSRLVALLAKKMAQRGQSHALAQHRSCLKRPPLGGRQAVRTPQNETLDRCRHGGGSNLARMKQQLLEEEWVAASPLYAGDNALVAGPQKIGRELLSLVSRERREVDGSDRRRTQFAPPAAIRRVAFWTRRQSQYNGRLCGHAGQSHQILEQGRIRPMNILDSHKDWPVSGQPRHQAGEQGPPAGLAGILVHCLVEGLPFALDGQVEQILERGAVDGG